MVAEEEVAGQRFGTVSLPPWQLCSHQHQMRQRTCFLR
jgi:hypothetical protein